MSGDSSAKTPAVAPVPTRIRTWGIVGAVGLGGLAFVVPQLALSAISPWLLQVLPFSQNVQNFVFMIMLEAVTVLAVAMLVHAYGQTMRDIGINKWQWRFIGWALAGLVVYFALSVAISMVASIFWKIDFNEAQDVGFASPAGLELIWVFLGLVILPPLAEEVLFRGFIFKGIRSRLSFVPTALIVSLLFALAHGQLNVGLDVFALSLVLCYLREKSNSLWPGILLHALKNAVAFFALFVYT